MTYSVMITIQPLPAPPEVVSDEFVATTRLLSIAPVEPKTPPEGVVTTPEVVRLVWNRFPEVLVPDELFVILYHLFIKDKSKEKNLWKSSL